MDARTPGDRRAPPSYRTFDNAVGSPPPCYLMLEPAPPAYSAGLSEDVEAQRPRRSLIVPHRRIMIHFLSTRRSNSSVGTLCSVLSLSSSRQNDCGMEERSRRSWKSLVWCGWLLFAICLLGLMAILSLQFADFDEE